MQRFEFVGDRSLSAFGVAREDGWVDHTSVPESLNQLEGSLRAPVDGNGSQSLPPPPRRIVLACLVWHTSSPQRGIWCWGVSRQKDRKGG